MENFTKEWLAKEAEATANNSFLDTLLFYMQEYEEYFNHSEVAEIFLTAYRKLAEQLIKELEAEDE